MNSFIDNGSVSLVLVLRNNERSLTILSVKGLADGEVQVIKMMAMAAQGPQ